LANNTQNQHLNKPRQQSASSSSEGNSDIDDEDEAKIDSNIPDDEKFFVHTDMEIQESVQPNNMMDIFRRQSSNPDETNTNKSNEQQKPVSSSTPERNINTTLSSDESQSRKVLNFVEQNGEMNSDDDDNDLSLQDNFSFLIAKGMLKPS
jgi:hypothetical protein